MRINCFFLATQWVSGKDSPSSPLIKYVSFSYNNDNDDDYDDDDDEDKDLFHNIDYVDDDDDDENLYGNLPMRFTILHIPIYMGIWDMGLCLFPMMMLSQRLNK